jgi:hypothetical protein
MVALDQSQQIVLGLLRPVRWRKHALRTCFAGIPHPVADKRFQPARLHRSIRVPCALLMQKDALCSLDEYSLVLWSLAHAIPRPVTGCRTATVQYIPVAETEPATGNYGTG